MKHSKHYRRFGLLILITSIINYACNNSSNTNPQINTVSTITELKIGGLYITKQEDGSYLVSKILAMDDFAVHLRTYSNNFKTKPTQLSSANLEIIIGHSPVDKKGFLIDNPELISVEDVKDSELEGYKIYQEEMRKNN